MRSVIGLTNSGLSTDEVSKVLSELGFYEASDKAERWEGNTVRNGVHYTLYMTEKLQITLIASNEEE